MDEFDNFFKDLIRNRKLCPWAKEQRFSDLLPYLKSEVEELVRAAENKDTENMKEELGDVMWDAMFLSIIAEEEFGFSIKDVLEGSRQKLIRRKPWVFSSMKINNADEAVRRWNEAKKREKDGQV